MIYTFGSFDTAVVGGKLRLPRHLLNTDEGDIYVFPTPYMTVRVSDEAHFNEVLDSAYRLPKNHRESILRLIHSKAVTVQSTTAASESVVHLMRDIYKDKADFRGEDPIPVRIENCGEYVQITVIE